MRKWTHRHGVTICAAAIALVWTLPVKADEPEDAGPYYEDDAWYDISEWFDGNDYNPTDEVAGVWDDEKYTARRGGDDQDNDWAAGTYGYDNDKSDDWFYDYYGRSYSYSNDPNDFTPYVWYDYNNDANFDAYRDTSKDGEHFYQFNDNAKGKYSANQKTQGREQSAAKRKRVNGTVKNLKDVSVSGKMHQIVQIDQNGETINVDLGPKDDLKQQKLSQGTKVSADGAVVSVAGKDLLIARNASINGKKIQINRSPMDVKGTVKSVKQASTRGNQKHMMAIVETRDGKKLAVDLGTESDELRNNLKEGEDVSVSGHLVKVKDRRVLLADSLEHNNRTINIARGASKAERPMASSR